MGFTRFMAGFWGRAIRVVAGLALIGWGVSAASATGTAVAVVGAIVALAGLFNFCLFAPLMGQPFWGKDMEKGAEPQPSTPSSLPEQMPQEEQTPENTL